ncbi:MAG: hypothetical protein E7170_03875 [Firmicutes bacterium]|nr:hypothetical protein [Bacillota bacterium]
MKKDEALLLAQQRTKLVIEYIEKILNNENNITGKINFSAHKIDNQMMCTLSILIPFNNFEKHLNLGITSEHCDILYAQLFKDLLKTFLEHETIGISRCFDDENFTGITANSENSKLNLNFIYKGQKFNEIAKEFNDAINIYVGQLNNKVKHG